MPQFSERRRGGGGNFQGLFRTPKPTYLRKFRLPPSQKKNVFLNVFIACTKCLFLKNYKNQKIIIIIKFSTEKHSSYFFMSANRTKLKSFQIGADALTQCYVPIFLFILFKDCLFFPDGVGNSSPNTNYSRHHR